MAIETTEPRALSAALSAPAFVTRGGGLAMHVADRHVERWAPEANANRVRPLRSLGFVDRLIAPWMETAQRSASMRLFSQYAQGGIGERPGGVVSWVFPRPWYQDELDWMAAARQSPATAPSLFTTRGTYVAPERPAQRPAALPSALYEYVAPSLSVAAPASVAGVGYGGEAVGGAHDRRSEPYSSLVPLAAVQAAEVMSRTVERLPGVTAAARMSPALRNVLSTMLERAASPRASEPTRLATQAPELVTPPAPRPDTMVETAGRSNATQVAEQYAEQRVRIAEVQRIARQSAEREIAARIETASSVTATAELRTAAARAEAEVRQRAAVTRTQSDEQRQVQTEQATTIERVAAEREAERARIEERVARRVAERTTTQRLHEQARTEAAAHARASTIEQPPIAADLAAEPSRAPAEVAAAIAALPPELASFLARRPGQALQAIDELNETFRTVELIARNAAVGGTFESARGPRLVMPSGLGGLVAAVDRVQTIADRPAVLAGERPAAFAPTIGKSPERVPMRVPAMSWLSTPTSAARLGAGPTSALAATATATPAALSHVAWADRWLARFAGASQQSLDTLAAGAGFESTRMQALAAAAPGAVFVSPFFDAEREGETVRFDGYGRTIVTPIAMASAAAVGRAVAPSLESPRAAVVRYDDNAETPDDVFAAISQSVSQNRGTSAPIGAAAPQPVLAPVERTTVADAVAQAAPASPGAGFAAQLASSPFAPALRHMLPLAAATSFDVRSLFGGGLSATYLSGLLAPASYEVEIAARELPTWTSWPAEAMGEPSSERVVPAWDATYVAPDAGDVGSSESIESSGSMPTSSVVAHASAPLTTLRTALLSWDGDAEGARADTASSVRTQTISRSTARSMVEAMSLPMLGDADRSEGLAGAGAGESWAAPGMVADRAHAWSVAQERSSSDLAFDFVTPELVLAARVYGLGPAAAAQAARLAVAGPGQLTAMASTVDRTFVQAMAIEADRRERVAIATAYPSAAGTVTAVGVPSRATAEPASTEQPPELDDLAPSTGTAFGVERRMPRGAFLWPSATIAALQLSAAMPDGQQSMSVAALELLAAQAVAEIGTYAALSEPAMASSATDRAAIDSSSVSGSSAPLLGSTGTAPGAFVRTLVGGETSRDGVAAEPSEGDVLGAAAALVPQARRARFDALYIALSQSPSGQTWSPAARAARALALAGRGGDEGAVSARERATTAWDVLPVVYAMDAIEAIDESMPVVGATGAHPAGTSRGESARRRGFAAGAGTGSMTSLAGPMDGDEPSFAFDVGPGLGGLSARAGEALGSYVTPTSTSSAPPSASASSAPREREVGAVLRAPTAAQEMVQTGRPSGRFGGGEVEIPTWFEAAARRMFESQNGTMGGDISMSELTLISTTPSNQIAASTKTAPSAAPLAPSSAGAGPSKGEQIDIEKIANEIYRHILVLMDVARARNGEPYL